MTSKEHLKQIRNLSVALFLSGALNILFTVLFFFWTFFYQAQLPPYLEQKPSETALKTTAISPSNADILRRYKEKSYEQVLPLLANTGLVENGYTERDLALGVLVAFHEFDLDRALGDQRNLLQKKLLTFNDGREKIVVYPNLTKAQFDVIVNFAKKEKWPLKAKGLFQQLKTTRADRSLNDAFYLTSEFASIEQLFKRGSREEIVQMIGDGSWGMLLAFYEKQKNNPDLSAENRQKLLLSYIKEGSKNAANLIIKTDLEFARRLSDPSVHAIISQMNENSPEAESFLNSIAGSQRQDGVKTYAIRRYQEIVGKRWEPLVSRKTVAVKPEVIEKAIAFQPQVTKPSIHIQPATKKALLYIIQDGDNLWKIAKRFKVSIEELRKINQLKNDSLKPGTPLKVPESGL